MQGNPFKELTEEALKAAGATDGFTESVRNLKPDEMDAIVTFMVNYKKQSPKASKRRIREAARKHFNIVTI